MKRILCYDMATSNFHNLISLVEEGHMVYTTPSSKFNATNYFESLGIQMIHWDEMPRNNTQLVKLLKDKKIDIVLLASPHWTHLRKTIEKHCQVIGLTEEAGALEKNKLEIYHKVKEIGLNVPELYMKDDIRIPCVVKPVIAQPPIDHAQIYLDHEVWEEKEEVRQKYDWYAEEYIEDAIETNVAYCVSNGKWSILHVQEIVGEDVAKMAGTYIHWTKTSSFKKLSDRNYDIAIKTAKTFLDAVVPTLGPAAFIGQLTGLLTKEKEWYFCENNVRPETTNSLPFFVTGDEWLRGMTEDPSIIGEAFPQNVDKAIVIPKEPLSPYPFHLHEEYGVAIPAGLDIVHGQYVIVEEMRRRSPDNIIGLVICDKTIPEEFLKKIETESDFEVKHYFKG